MNITLHLPTAAITVAIGSLALFGMSASAPQNPAANRDVQAFQDVGQPAPEDLFWLATDGTGPTTYTVPAGRSLVLTGIVGFNGYAVYLTIDGGPGRTFRPNPELSLFTGIGLAEGQTISLDGHSSGTYQYHLIGYLVDA